MKAPRTFIAFRRLITASIVYLTNCLIGGLHGQHITIQIRSDVREFYLIAVRHVNIGLVIPKLYEITSIDELSSFKIKSCLFHVDSSRIGDTYNETALYNYH